MRSRLSAALALWLTATPVTAAGTPPLLTAVAEGDRAAVEALLAQRADPSQAASDGTTPLLAAAERGHLDLARRLIDAGANASAANRYGATPLYAAAVNGDAAMLGLLLSAGADVNAPLPGGQTALMTAARSGSVPALRTLLAKGAAVNAAEARGSQTALMWAAAEGHVEAVRALVEAGADIGLRSKSGLSALLFAVRQNRPAAVRALLENGADVNDAIRITAAATPPAAAATTGPAAGFRPAGKGVNLEGMSALTLAIANAHYDLAIQLIDAGAKVNDNALGWTPLHQLMFTRRPNPEAVVYAAPLTAKADSLAVATALLAGGADVNARMDKEPCGSGGITNAGDSRPVTAPHQTFSLPCFDFFGNRNNMNRLGATPLLLAAKAADAEMMRFLASHGADPSLTTTEGVTPLMAAAGVGIYKLGLSPGTNDEALEATQVALELGGDVTTVDSNGDTALHGAAIRGANPLIQLLVDRGARLDVANNLGWTPLTIADGVRYTQTLVVAPESAELLRRLMAARGLPVPPPPTSSTTAVKDLAAR